MIRAELVRLSADSHILHVSIHHALFDGMSMTVLTRELAEIYQAYFDGKPCPLEPLPIQFGDYSVWQKEFLEGPEMKKQLGYWKQRLEGMAELDLPTDFPRPPVKSWKGEITSTLLPKELTDRLHATRRERWLHLVPSSARGLHDPAAPLHRQPGCRRRHPRHRPHARRTGTAHRRLHQLAHPALRSIRKPRLWFLPRPGPRNRA